MNISLSGKIRDAKESVIHNQFQGTDKKVLFVCSMGILRSASAARIYAKKYNTRCAGIASDALIPLTQLLIDWADEVVFMQRYNYNTACHVFGSEVFDYKCVVLDVDDNYPHMAPALIRQFKRQYGSTVKVKKEEN